MNNNNLLHSDLSYKIRGCAFHVYNTLGSGHKEIVYQNALAKTFTVQKIHFQTEVRIPIIFEKERVGIYRPDFVIEDKIIIELKASEFNIAKHNQQLLYYLKGSSFRLGFLINFGTSPITIIRKIN